MERKAGSRKKKFNVGEQPLITDLLGDSIILEIQYLIMFQLSSCLFVILLLLILSKTTGKGR